MEEFKTDVFDTIKADSIPIITQSDSPVKDPVQLESFIDEEETEDDDDQFEDADDSELLIPETSVTTTNNNEDDNGSSNFNDTVIHNDLDSSRDKITNPISIQIDKAKTITPKKQKRMSRLISTNSQSLNMIGSSPVNSDNEISNFEENLDIDLDLGIDINESHDIDIDYNNHYQNDNDDIVNDTDIDYGKETELDSKNNFKLRNTNISKPQMLKSLEISNDAPWRRAAAASRAAPRSSNINNRPISRLSYYESNNNNNSTMIHDSNLSGMMSGLSFNDNVINSVSNIQEIERLQKEVINYQVQLKLLTRLLNEKLQIDNDNNNTDQTNDDTNTTNTTNTKVNERLNSILKNLDNNFIENLTNQLKQKDIFKKNEIIKDYEKNINKIEIENKNLKNQLKELVSSFDEIQPQMDNLQLTNENSIKLSNDILLILTDHINENENDKNQLNDEIFKITNNSNDLELKLETIEILIEQFITSYKELKILLDNEINFRKNFKFEKEFELNNLKSNLNNILKTIEFKNEKFNEFKKNFKKNNNNDNNNDLIINEKLINLENDLNNKIKFIKNLKLKNLKINNELNFIKNENLNLKNSDIKVYSSHKDKEFENLKINYNNLKNLNNKLKIEFKDEESKLLSIIHDLNLEIGNKETNKFLKFELNELNEKYNLLKKENLNKIKINNENEILKKNFENLNIEFKNFKKLSNNELKLIKNDKIKLIKEIKNLNLRFNHLLTNDINFSTHMIKNFAKILDKKSIKDAAEKILYLADRNKIGLDEETINKLHKIIFEYHLTAINIICNDHMNLAVKSNENELKIKELNEKIKILTTENENLKINSSIDINPSTSNNNNNILPPPTNNKGEEFGDRLRLEELTKRWKLAEEKLLFERTESNKKLKELENEILILKKK